VIEFAVQEIRKSGGVVDTRTIIPINSQYHQTTARPTTKAFVFIQTEAGKENELMNELLYLPEVLGVHLLFGKADLLTELNAEKSFGHPHPNT